MSALFCFGLSYTATAYIAEYGAQFARVSGTVRAAEKAGDPGQRSAGGRAIDVLPFEGGQAAEALSSALQTATLLLISIPPDADGDVALAHHTAALGRACALRSVVYLSTVGVYGDHGGGWVDETTPANPISPRSRERLVAERQWQDFGRRMRVPVAIFRLPGIYGPGRNALANLMRGEAKRIVKPGQVFNRIHVHDIAQAIEAAYHRQADGVFNICDDMPAPGQDLVTHAAELLGIAPPPEQDYEAIRDAMSPMARGFYTENKRVRNARMKAELGVTLTYPTYREGLRALLPGVRAGE